ncbi:TonB-dependent receptor [Sphingomonas sp. DBB INV C78]|uniref:TonB-dependent receptor n=1 Tax=Sphingomonas sp. DBB INV C78 TaxID=3349434 RepID=UPI0036D354D6
MAVTSCRRARFIIAALLAASSTAALAADVTGVVLDGSSTRALEGAEVSIVELGRKVEAKRDGSYRFADVPPGTYTLRAHYSGVEDFSESVTVADTGLLNKAILLGDADSLILVMGQQANLSSSLSRQRAADGVESVLTRDSIGQFPDQNVAEAIRRAPGVNVLNDQGEGRFIAVRGLDPNLNAASINGVRVPAPEADTRSVALDVVASELVEAIEIKKSLTPDMDGDTIGASVEIKTTSAFDRRKDLLAVSVEGSYNDYAESLTPKGSVDFSTRITDNFGIAGGVSYYKRRFETDNIEADDWNDEGLAESLEYRDYDVRRLRTGGSLSLDWRPSSTTKLYAKGIYNRFSDQEDRRRLVFDLGDANLVDADGTTRATVNSGDLTDPDDESRIRVERDLKDRFEVQKIQSYQLGGVTETGPWTFTYSGAWSKATEVENGSIDPIVFRRDFEAAEGDDLTVDFDYSDYKIPEYSVSGPSSDDFYDPSQYEFDKFERTTLSDSSDREWNFRGDVAYAIPLSQGTFTVQAGGKARLRQKNYDLTLDVFDGFDGDFTVADVLGKQTYRLAMIDPVVKKRGERDFINANIDGFEINEIDSLIESNIADYRVGEDVYSGYLMGRYEAGPLRVIGGVRVERTENDLEGNFVTLLTEGTEVDGVELDEDTVVISPNRIKRHYTDWLPSALVRYEASDELVFRLGAFKSLVRPNIGQLAPRVQAERDGDDSEVDIGNPLLKPYRAWNVDVGAEWYFAPSSALQGGFFYKKLKDYIVEQAVEDYDYNGFTYDEALIRYNSGDADITGFEIAYSQAFRSLPAPFDGLLTNINYTYTDADGAVPNEDGSFRNIPLLNSSKHTFNVVLGYEKGPISIRLAGTYRDKYLDELRGSAEEDRYVRDHFQLDASAKYRVMDNVTIFGELVNINNAKYVAYQRGPNTRRLLQYEEYSFTAKFGIRANF